MDSNSGSAPEDNSMSEPGRSNSGLAVRTNPTRLYHFTNGHLPYANKVFNHSWGASFANVGHLNRAHGLVKDRWLRPACLHARAQQRQQRHRVQQEE